MNQIGLNSNKIVNFKATQTMQLQNPQMQQEQSMPNVQLPRIYQIPPEKNKGESFKEKLKKWDVMGLVYQWFEHPFLMLGTCAGLAWGVDKFSSACGGQYETSLVGKAAKLGDNIQTSNFVQSKPFQSVLNAGKAVKNKFNKIFKNSDIINAVKNTPSEPEWRFVKDELLTMRQRVVHDFSNVTRTLKLNSEGFVELTDLGLDKAEKEFIKKFSTEEMASNAVQLKRIGLADDAIRDIISKPDATKLVKAKQLEKLGIDVAFLEKLEKNPATLRDIVKVRNACQNASGMRIGAGYQKWLGPFQPFERKIGLDGIGNRLHSTLRGAKTKTGQAFSNFLQKCHRGFTFGGGKIGVLLFVSPLLVETMLDIKKAEPNEKLGTAAHGGVHAISWVFTFPLALSIMHRLAGVQYAGMSKEAVEECRKLIKEFNEKTNPYKECGFFDKLMGRAEKKASGEFFENIAEYNDAKTKLKARLKELHKTKDQNLLTKISKKLGKFVTMDLETISRYKGGAGSFGNVLHGFGNTMKNVCGVPLRVGLWAALTMGVLDTLINKGIKGCFGNYYDRYKEEEFEEAKKTQKKFLKEDLKNRLYEAQQEKVLGVTLTNNNFKAPEQIQAKLKEEKIKAQKEAEQKRKNQAINTNRNTEEQISSDPNVQAEADNKLIENQDNDVVTKNNTTQLEKETVVLAKTAQENVLTDQNNPIPEFTKDTNANTMSNSPFAPKQKETIDTNTYIPSSQPVKIKPTETIKRDNYTYIPSSENLLKKDEKDTNEQKYIPSQEGVKFTKTFDNSHLEAALRRADRAEERAIQTLAGNFNSY